MRVLVCGDRNWEDHWIIMRVLRGIYEGARDWMWPLVVVHGAAPGADSMANACAGDIGAVVEPYPAEWDKYGRAAGPRRNQQMLDEGKPDVVLAFHDNLAESKGTGDMVRRAKKAGLPVYVISRA